MPNPSRRKGRPAIDPNDPDESVRVCVRIPAKQYDELYRQAGAGRVSVPQLIRQSLNGRDPKATPGR